MVQRTAISTRHAIAEYGVHQYGTQQLRVTIAGFNKRAQRVWEQLGFEQVEKFVKINSGDEFVVMVRKIPLTI